MFFLPNLISPLFCRWWNCPSPYIIWNMSWWSRTYEELDIISSRPTLPSPLFSVMIPLCSKFMIKRWLTCFWGLYYCYYSFFYILLFYRTTLVYIPFLFLIPSSVPKAHFLASSRTKCCLWLVSWCEQWVINYYLTV